MRVRVIYFLRSSTSLILSAVTKGSRSTKVDKSWAGNSNSSIVKDEPGGFISDGAPAGGRGRARAGKARATSIQLKDVQVSHDVANGRRSTRSCNSNIIPGIGDDSSKLPQGTSAESSTMVIRMTRMRSSNLRSSF